MADEGSLIETGVDRLLRYVKNHGEVELQDASESLGAEQETVLNWAAALEESGLIDIRYSARRGRVLTPVEGEVAEEKMEAVREETSKELEKLKELEADQAELQQFREILEKMEDTLEDDREDVEGLEAVLEGENLDFLKKYLVELQDAESEIEALEADLDDLISGLELLSSMEEALGETEEEGGNGLVERLLSLLPGQGETFKCGRCGKEFDTERGLRTHEGMVHDE